MSSLIFYTSSHRWGVGIRDSCFWEEGSGFRVRKSVAGGGNPSTMVHCGSLVNTLHVNPLCSFVINFVGVAVFVILLL